MSVVTTVLLTTSLNEGGMRYLNEYLEQKGLPHLCKVNHHSGGNKAPQQEVWLGAYNCLEDKEFIEKVRSIRWDEPSSVQLFLNGENDDKFYGAFGHFASWFGRHFWGSPERTFDVQGTGPRSM